MAETPTRGIVVHLSSGQRCEYPNANAYSFTGPNKRDQRLVEWDWDNHKLHRHVAYFPAGGWIGMSWADLASNEHARRIGFEISDAETELP